MVLATLSQELLAQAKEDAAKIVAAARKEADDLLVNAKREAQEFKKTKQEQYVQEKEAANNKELSRAHGDAKKLVLQAQGKLFTTIREETTKRLQEATKEQKTQLYKKMLTNAQTIIQAKTVVCNEDDKKLVEKITSVPVITKKGFFGIRLENNDESVTIAFEDLITDVLSEQEQDIMAQVTRL